MASAMNSRADRIGHYLAVAAVLAVALWAYYPTLLSLAHLWSTDPNYSQGFLVPMLAVGLLWYRCRGDAPMAEPSLRWGLGLLALAAVFRGAAAYFFITPLDHLSFLVLLVGLCLLLGGRHWLVRAWPALALLVFMFPIPNSVGGSNVIAGLQTVATRSSVFVLQTLGVVAARDGNVILLKETEVGIVEACSGLRMLMVFCALTVVTAALIPGGWPRKTLLVVSAVPLAIGCNVIRITTAGLASESLGTEAGHFVFHDLAGWLMVPLAFVLLGGEVYVLSKLFRLEGSPAPLSARESTIAKVLKEVAVA